MGHVMDKWDLARSAGVCAASGRTLAEGEEFYAVLFEDNGTLRREDYSLEAWKGPPDLAFCAFKSRIPVKEKKKRPAFNTQVLIDFFQRLEAESERSRLQFRFVLALILMRKRILRFEETIHDPQGDEYWQMRMTKEQTLHRVLNPRLNEEEIERLSKQLASVLEGADPMGDEAPSEADS